MIRWLSWMTVYKSLYWFLQILYYDKDIIMHSHKQLKLTLNYIKKITI